VQFDEASQELITQLPWEQWLSVPLTEKPGPGVNILLLVVIHGHPKSNLFRPQSSEGHVSHAGAQISSESSSGLQGRLPADLDFQTKRSARACGCLPTNSAHSTAGLPLMARTEQGDLQTVWRTLSDLRWLSLSCPESKSGGMGRGASASVL
jgi:hypothetical protein